MEALWKLMLFFLNNPKFALTHNELQKVLGNVYFQGFIKYVNIRLSYIY